MEPPPRGLWRHRPFLRLWAAQSLSAIGSRISRTAIPIIAIDLLAASPGEVAVLGACGVLPMAIAGLLGGGFVERSRKRRLMVAADIGRAGLVLLLPVAAWLGVLELWLLILITAVIGAATALFQNADVAFLPHLVGGEHVLDANSKIQATESIAEVTGPGIAGVLIDLVTAPVAIVVDAASFVWSAIWLAQIPDVEPAELPEAAAGRPSLRARARSLMDDLAVGWRAVMGAQPLRSVALALMFQHVSIGFFLSLYMLLALRVLGLTATEIGLIISVGGIGGLAGAFVASRLVAALGFGPALLASFATAQLGLVLLLVAASIDRATIPLLVGQQLIGDGGMLAFMVLSRSLLQTRVAPTEIARANGLLQAAGGVLVPAAGLLAGGLAEVLGIRTGVILGIGFGVLGIAPLLSPSVLKFSAFDRVS